MKKIIFFILFMFPFYIFSELIKEDRKIDEYGIPLKFINGYEIDLNLDKKIDMVIYVQIGEKYTLIAMLNKGEKYEGYILNESERLGRFFTDWQNEVTSKEAGPGQNNAKTYKIPGPCIVFSIPEVSSVVYYWDKGKFNEIWTSD